MYRKTRILLVIVLSTIMIANMFNASTISHASSNEYIIPTDLSFGDWGQLVSVTFEENGTHLNVYLLFDGILPNASSKGMHVIRYFTVGIDVDNNPFTGDNLYGEEAYYFLAMTSHNLQTSLRETIYVSNGTLSKNTNIEGYLKVSENSPYMNLSIPLGRLNLTSNNVFVISQAHQSNYIYDYLSENGNSETYPNVSIPTATITVDGDPSDWHGLVPIPPVAIDSHDPFDIPYQELNLTAFYVTRDNNYLYLRFDFNGKYYSSKFRGPFSTSYALLSLKLDIDNDGTADYYLSLYRDSNSIRIYNASERKWHNYYKNKSRIFLRGIG